MLVIVAGFLLLGASAQATRLGVQATHWVRSTPRAEQLPGDTQLTAERPTANQSEKGLAFQTGGKSRPDLGDFAELEEDESNDNDDSAGEGVRLTARVVSARTAGCLRRESPDLKRQAARQSDHSARAPPAA
jgi:hypothetical protein